MLQDATDAVVGYRIDAVAAVVQGLLDAGVSPGDVLSALCEGMGIVGARFEARELFLAELVMAGETMKEALKTLEPHLQLVVKEAAEGDTVSELVTPDSRGKIVLGTVEGDMHDIGKDIMSILLTSSRFTVYDLGIDVSPEDFVLKAKEVGADIIGVSALLSVTIPMSAKIVQALKNAKMRDRVKVILGGGAVRKWAVEKFGVDAATNDAMEGLKIIQSWMRGKQ